MKKVMIIGKLDDVTKDIYDSLAPICHPQICADSKTVIQGMLKMYTPDVIIVSLTDSGSDPEDIFFHLETETFHTPIIAIGPVQIQSRLIKSGYLPKKRILFMQTPIKMESMVTCVKKFLAESAKAKENGPKKILVVDDDPTMLRIIQRMLSKRYTVSVATSGPQAIMAVSKSMPDLILLDYDMPLVDGRMTLQMLRSEEGTRDIPVVFLTGLSDPAQVEDAIALHPQGYLRKPPTESKIFGKLAAILGEELPE